MSLWSALFGGGSGGSGSVRVDGATARKLVSDGALLLDVRTPTEYGAGHLPDAVNVPVDQLARRLDEIPQGRDIVVYCRSGARSAHATQLLRDAGFQNAWNVNGGILAWCDRIDPVLSGS